MNSSGAPASKAHVGGGGEDQQHQQFLQEIKKLEDTARQFQSEVSKYAWLKSFSEQIR